MERLNVWQGKSKHAGLYLAPRAFRRGEMETLLTFVETCAGRPLKQWEANVLETLVKAANENEAVHG